MALTTVFREGFLMELLSAILGDLVSRSINFMIDKYPKQQVSVDENLQRLHHLLLRIRTIVEEAEQRHVANHGMVRQLELLREQMFKGYCLLDAFRFRDDDDEVRLPFAPSKFNRAKRIRFSDSSSSSKTPIQTRSTNDLHQTVSSLERIIGDTKEFVVFLMSYPPIYRQPYSTHLYLDRCMFSRHMEKENVISFLLQAEPLASETVQVLPVDGPTLVGKSTFVEHICSDQRVRDHFSPILYYSADDLTDEKVANFRENCQTKHRNESNGAVDVRLLLIIELLGDVNDRAFKKMYSSFRKQTTHETKVIITSRSEKITRLGATQALRLNFLPFEAYWYFFKVLAFGSTDPEQHPKLASMAMEIAAVLRGCFLCAHIGGALLKANFNVHFWSRFLAFAREYRDECNSLVSCDCQENGSSTEDHPQFGWAIVRPKPAKYFVLRDSYQKALAEDDGPKTTLVDLLSGRVKRRGKFEVLVWKSRIPPYYSYISNCVM